MMQLTTRELVNLSTSLAQLDGREKAFKDGERHHIIREPYKFGRGVRFAIAKNIAAMRPRMDAYHKIRDGLIVKASGGLSQVAKSEEVAEFQKMGAMLLDEVQEDIALVSMTEEELRLDVNDIPGTVIAGLAPLIAGMMPSPEPDEPARE